MFPKTETPKKFFIFQETETPKKILILSEMKLRYISGNVKFLYFGKGIFRTLAY